MNHRYHVVFERFAGAQAGDGNVLLAIVGVDRSLLLQWSAEILHGIVAGLHHGAILFDDTDVGNLHPLVGGVVANLNLPPLLNSGLALHADASDGLFATGAIAFKAVA